VPTVGTLRRRGPAFYEFGRNATTLALLPRTRTTTNRSALLRRLIDDRGSGGGPLLRRRGESWHRGAWGTSDGAVGDDAVTRGGKLRRGAPATRRPPPGSSIRCHEHCCSLPFNASREPAPLTERQQRSGRARRRSIKVAAEHLCVTRRRRRTRLLSVCADRADRAGPPAATDPSAHGETRCPVPIPGPADLDLSADVGWACSSCSLRRNGNRCGGAVSG